MGFFKNPLSKTSWIAVSSYCGADYSCHLSWEGKRRYEGGSSSQPGSLTNTRHPERNRARGEPHSLGRDWRFQPVCPVPWPFRVSKFLQVSWCHMWLSREDSRTPWRPAQQHRVCLISIPWEQRGMAPFCILCVTFTNVQLLGKHMQPAWSVTLGCCASSLSTDCITYTYTRAAGNLLLKTCWFK